MLSATQLDVMRGGRTVVAGVSFDVDDGCALVFHGANGSGKSTLMATLAGLIAPNAGSVSWRGADVRDEPARYRRELAYLGHSDGLSGEMTVIENLRFSTLLGSRLAHAALVRREAAVLDAAGLAHARTFRVNRLSAGQRRRVALARLVLADKPLWIVDEPTDALDDAAAAWFTACIDTHLHGGGTVIAATHRPLGIDAQRTRHLHLERSAPCCA
jgi:heme exporter protein A